MKPFERSEQKNTVNGEPSERLNEVSSSQGMQAATMASMQVLAGQGQRSTTSP